MKRNILVDAGPLIALFDRSDRYHLKVLKYMEHYEGRLTTTWPVITEVLHMLDFNVAVQLDFMNWIKMDGLDLFDLKGVHWERLIQLTNNYSDIPMDLADATLIIAAEELKMKEILSIDSDFYIYRTIRNKYLKNVLS